MRLIPLGSHHPSTVLSAMEKWQVRVAGVLTWSQNALENELPEHIKSKESEVALVGRPGRFEPSLPR